MDRKIRVSAKALVIRDGCMLAIRLRDADGEFCIMPGGGQIPGELLPAAAEREVAEETGLAVRAGEIVFVIEGAQGVTDWDISDVKFMTIDGEQYAFIRRPRPSQDYRLKSIELVEHGSEKAIAMGETPTNNKD